MSQKTILFGASKLGTLAYEYFKDSYDICYYCDNDIRKTGTSFNGIEIISVNRMVQLVKEGDYYIIISSHYYKEIGEQLIIKGIDKKQFKVFYNSLEYLQTIDDINQKTENLRGIARKDNIDYNRNIFAKYNVHLMIDSIFCKTFINNVNKDHKNNLFLILGNNLKPKYINGLDDNSNVEFLDLKDYSIYLKLHTYIYGCNKLFIHFLSDDVCDILDEFNIYGMNCEKNWIIWGADLYNYIDFNLYEEKTHEFIKDKLYYLDSQNIRRDTKKLEIRRKIIKDMDRILHWNKGDYELLLKNFETNAELVNFAYGINIDLRQLDKIRNKSDQSFKKQHGFKHLFLIGNSATMENNHIDIFWRLKYLNMDDYGVVLPLSYGNRDYARELIEAGKSILGNRLIIIDKYLSTYEYFNIINQMDAVIMNHIRQQATGNTYGALYLGKVVFMNKKSTVFKYYYDKGLKIYDIENIRLLEVLISENNFTNINSRFIKDKYAYDYTGIE